MQALCNVVVVEVMQLTYISMQLDLPLVPRINVPVGVVQCQWLNGK